MSDKGDAEKQAEENMIASSQRHARINSSVVVGGVVGVVVGGGGGGRPGPIHDC
ncbi:hypothetical protein N9L68_08295 [bacterium]|nr:hypothetical protein [bacterium]